MQAHSRSSMVPEACSICVGERVFIRVDETVADKSTTTPARIYSVYVRATNSCDKSGLAVICIYARDLEFHGLMERNGTTAQ